MKTTHSRLATLFLLALAATFAADASAAVIHLDNQDRLTGRIVRMESGTLVIDSEYAGELQVPWSMVRRIESDEPITAYLKQGGEMKGAPSSPEPGELSLENGDAAPMDQVKSINALPDLKYSARVQAGYDKSSGNTRQENFHLSGGGSVRYQDHRLKGSGEYNLAKDRGEETADNWRANLGYDRFLTERLYANVNGMLEHDKFAGLRLRKVLGPGMGYQFFDNDVVSLSAETGVNYVGEDYYPGVETDDSDYAAGRWAVDLEWWVYEKYAKFYHKQFGLVSMARAENVILQTRTGLRIPIKKNFFTALQYNYDWRNTPPEGKRRYDQQYVITLGYELN